MYRHHYNITPSNGQKFTEPSRTVQGQSLSIAQMFERISKGLTVSIHQGNYSDDEEPIFEPKDLTDIDALKAEHQSLLNSIKKEQEKQKQEMPPEA